MTAQDLLQKLKELQPDIDIINQYWEKSTIEDEYKRLNSLSMQEDFWQNPNQAEILKSLQKVKTQRDQYYTLINTYNDLPELLQLFSDDEQELLNLKKEVGRLKKGVTQFKVTLLLHDEQDSSACFLNINAGAGGTESQDWAHILLRMYLRFCEREGLPTQTVDFQSGEEAGIKSATLYIKGTNPYGLLKSEHGIHRLVRISPFDANKRRHTSFAAVHLIPEVPEVEVEINPQDLRIDTYRAGGAGGQHVNKTDSAVRITHIPSGIVVQCQNERSQLQNKETAMKMLKAKLYQKAKEEKAAQQAGIEKKKIEWGSQIRSYILHPYKMVKDHRTNFESPQPELVLDGELMDFIEKYLIECA